MYFCSLVFQIKILLFLSYVIINAFRPEGSHHYEENFELFFFKICKYRCNDIQIGMQDTSKLYPRIQNLFNNGSNEKIFI